MKNKATRAILLLILAACAYAVVMVSKMCPAVLATHLQEDLGIGNAALPLLSGSTILVAALASIPVGYMTDRVGPRITTACLLCCCMTGMLLFAWSASFHLSIAARCIVGFGGAIMSPLVVFVSRIFEPNRLSMATGVLMSGGNLGTVFAMAPIAFGAAAIGWRQTAAFVAFIAGILMLCAILFFGASNRNQPAKTAPSSKERKVTVSFAAILKDRHIVMLFVWNLFAPGLIMAFASLWWGPYLTKGAGLPQHTAGNILSMATLVNCGSLIVSAWLSDSVFKSRKKVLILATACGLIGIAGMIACKTTPSIILHLVFGICFYMGFGGAVSVASASALEAAPQSLKGTVASITLIGMTLGGTVMQFLYGFIVEIREQAVGLAGAYGEGLMLFFGAACLALLATFFMRETHPGAKSVTG